MPAKPKVQKQKPEGIPKEAQASTQQQPAAFKDTDGLTGEGSDSVMTHLQEMERQRSRDKDDPR